jgi:hypothetical protein
MRRIEQDPEEIQQEQDALARAATPTHERVTEEIDTQELLLRLGQTGTDRLVLRDPPEFGWDIVSPSP